MKKLQVGDVFEIKKDMEVCTEVPERFVYGNRIMSMVACPLAVKVGVVLEVADSTSLKNLVTKTTKSVCEAAEGYGIKLGHKDWKGEVQNLIRRVIESRRNLPSIYDTSVLLGEYVVEEATVHGPWDGYPVRGWHIKARKLNDKGNYDKRGRVITFYQSGYFNTRNANVPAIRKLVRKSGKA